jgi:hypothetical protein
MKFLKADGTVEDGTPLTDEQAAEKQRVEELLHVVLCKNSYHYDWQGMPACKKVSQEVATGTSWIDSLEGLKPKPRPEQEVIEEPVPVQVSIKEVTEEEVPL